MTKNPIETAIVSKTMITMPAIAPDDMPVLFNCGVICCFVVVVDLVVVVVVVVVLGVDESGCVECGEVSCCVVDDSGSVGCGAGVVVVVMSF